MTQTGTAASAQGKVTDNSVPWNAQLEPAADLRDERKRDLHAEAIGGGRVEVLRQLRTGGRQLRIGAGLCLLLVIVPFFLLFRGADRHP